MFRSNIFDEFVEKTTLLFCHRLFHGVKVYLSILQKDQVTREKNIWASHKNGSYKREGVISQKNGGYKRNNSRIQLPKRWVTALKIMKKLMVSFAQREDTVFKMREQPRIQLPKGRETVPKRIKKWEFSWPKHGRLHPRSGGTMDKGVLDLIWLVE